MLEVGDLKPKVADSTYRCDAETHSSDKLQREYGPYRRHGMCIVQWGIWVDIG
jgi:hypothetical protein